MAGQGMMTLQLALPENYQKKKIINLIHEFVIIVVAISNNINVIIIIFFFFSHHLFAWMARRHEEENVVPAKFSGGQNHPPRIKKAQNPFKLWIYWVVIISVF